MRTLTITRPDDWHVHLRDGDYLPATVRDISRYFGRAIVMPNLVPPVSNVDQAREYRDRIVSSVPDTSCFSPLMTLYLTDETNEDTVVRANQSGFIKAFKLYPAGTTTNSEAGVAVIENLYPTFEAMQKHGMPLAVHGEVTDNEVDIFDRETVFIEQQLQPIVDSFPGLKIIFEHITTRQAVEFVQQAPDSVAATITAHHLLFNRNDLLAGSIRPIYYCLPVLKRSEHQQALLSAATSGNRKFFLGTDSAPHPRAAKENVCGCAAGCYTAHAAIELYAEAFDSVDKLDQLEVFASHHGSDFYELPRNSDTITLSEQSWDVPVTLSFGPDELVPIRTGEQIRWRVTTKEMD
ncbi:MAG: dihydroorotase [Gammaproteobacteria bacterium]|nr:dihydroorotase [Gammaproteobacteria bacterium]